MSTSRPTAELRDGAAVLAVAIDAGEVLRLRYRLANDGEVPLAVFDRGTNQRPGGGVFRIDLEGEGDASIAQTGLPLPDPAPTRPILPLARVLPPGGSAEGELLVPTPVEAPARDAGGRFGMVQARRVRYCLGVADFVEEDFVDRGEGVWMPTLRVIEQGQRILCTPWFDPARGRFAE
ncbi:hypothetical protein [Coralloluteibacterium thermophilus]|uniref:Uncharacterized protein n=1 Tax=Coralloluteibacterium thermophilum TaxID=2707049 RepID=A0ABV9NE43_9GAMM